MTLRLSITLAAVALCQPVSPAYADTLSIRQMPIALTAGDHAAATDPALRIAGAWTLASDDRRLGGLSAMAVQADGIRFVSDAGVLLHVGGDRDAAQIEAAALRLPAPCGRTERKKAGDAESIALAPDGSGLRIGMERTNAICALSFGDAAPSVTAWPAMTGWRRNKGAEAMASLPGGGMVIISEGADAKDGTRPFLWFAGDASLSTTRQTAMRYMPPKGFKPGDAAFLPDGRMIILNRKHGMGGRYASVLTLLPAFTPAEGQRLQGREIARIEGTGIAANYEGLAIVPRPGGATLWMVTDNNFAQGKKTLLLRLEWDDKAGAIAASP